MRRLIGVAAVVAAVVLLAWQSAYSVRADEPTVLVIEIDGAIEPLSAAHIARGLDKAREDGVSLAVIRLDTPGGLVDSTREIVERLLEAQVPVAVYVSPAGARAASAGTFVAAAANFAVMAPGTNIGAAAAVGAGGADLPETLARKIDEDTRAFIRSIAEIRDRNGDALEETVSKPRPTRSRRPWTSESSTSSLPIWMRCSSNSTAAPPRPRPVPWWSSPPVREWISLAARCWNTCWGSSRIPTWRWCCS